MWAVVDRSPIDRFPRGTLITEEHWSDIVYQRTQSYYAVSKTLAEQAAWDFWKELPKSEQFELVTLLPSMVTGKALHNRTFTSGEIVQKIFNGEFPAFRVMFPFVNVKDVSRAHVQAIKVAEARN